MLYSPSQTMQLIERIENALWNKFDDHKYAKVKRYMKLWQKDVDWDGNFESSCKNFEIIDQPGTSVIDLSETLHQIKDIELLLQIAFDLGIEVPSVIYGVPEVKTILADSYKNVFQVFEEAYKKLESEPDIAISIANASLERLIRELCIDTNQCKKGDSLYDLISHILKEYDYFPSKNLNTDIRDIGGGILKIIQGADNIRSNYTIDAHGSLNPKYMKDQPLYAKLIFNSISTIALFLIGLKQSKKEQTLDDIPF